MNFDLSFVHIAAILISKSRVYVEYIATVSRTRLGGIRNHWCSERADESWLQVVPGKSIWYVCLGECTSTADKRLSRQTGFTIPTMTTTTTAAVMISKRKYFSIASSRLNGFRVFPDDKCKITRDAFCSGINLEVLERSLEAKLKSYVR